jgi:hypothetical protein
MGAVAVIELVMVINSLLMKITNSLMLLSTRVFQKLLYVCTDNHVKSVRL